MNSTLPSSGRNGSSALPTAEKAMLRSWAPHVLMLLARSFAGITIARAGFSKLPTPDWMRDQVAQIGFPAPSVFAYLASITEFAGGVLLLLGLWTRSVSVMLALTMAVAAFGYHRVSPLVEMHIAQGFVWLFVMFVATGPGRLSIDRLLVNSSGGQRNQSVESETFTSLGGRKLAAAFMLAGVPLVYGTYRELAMNPGQRVAATDLEIETIHIAGSFNEWSLTATPMQREPGTDRWWAEVQLTDPEAAAFKFVANGSWELNLGAGPDDLEFEFDRPATGVLNGADIRIPISARGKIRIEVESDTLSYTVRRTGDARSG